MEWDKFKEKLEANNFLLYRKLTGNYYISYNDEEIACITDEALMRHGTNYKDYTHTKDCELHPDNLPDYFGVPYCECPFEVKMTNMRPALDSIWKRIVTKKLEIMVREGRI